MYLVIVGPGALGSLLTTRISLFQEEREKVGAGNATRLVLLDYRPERAAYLARHGLILEDGDRRLHGFPIVTAEAQICAEADILFLCMKSIAFSAAVEMVRPFLSPAQVLVGMQNGIGHLAELSGLPCIPAVGVTSEGATMLARGHVRHGGAGLTRIGLLDRRHTSVPGILRQTAALFNGAGLATQLVDDPLQHVWAKLLVNVGINALTAIHRCRNGELLRSAPLRKTMEQAVREAEAVARAKNIPVAGDPVAATLTVCERTGHNISSMLQDVNNGRRTEIEAINGAIVAEGERLGIATPVNRELVRLVREIEAACPHGFDHPEES